MSPASTQPAPTSQPAGAARGTLASTHSALLVALGPVMAAALAVVAPLFFLGNASGHDIGFHLDSWMDAAAGWRQGVLYPRWAAWANYGFGEPRFIFYPPASWMLGAGLGCILPWRGVPGAFIWLALTLAGVAMFRLAREWMPAGPATRAAVFYAANPYHLVVVYFRSDFAELLASALFPLVVLYAARIGRGPSTSSQGSNAARRTLWGDVVPLAVVLAAIWLTNAPAAVVVTYSLALLLAVFAVMRRSAVPVLVGATAMVLGFFLAGFYIVPAAFEQGWVNIAEALSSGLRPEQNFLFTFINDPEHNVFNLLVSTIAAAQISITAVAALASKPGSQLSKGASEFWWGSVALAAASVALMLPVTSLAWRYLPKLRFVQFPWRWLIPLSLAFAMFVAVAIQQTRAQRFWTVLVVTTLVLVGAYLVHETWWDTKDAPTAEMAIKEGKGYEGTDEYAPRGTDHYDLPAAGPLVGVVPADKAGVATGRDTPAHVRVERWAVETKVITVEAPQPVTLALRLLNYPAWQVEVNGRPARAESQENTGEMLLRVPAGRSRVRVRFARTPDRTAGILLSTGAGMLLAGLALAQRRRRNAADAGKTTEESPIM